MQKRKQIMPILLEWFFNWISDFRNFAPRSLFRLVFCCFFLYGIFAPSFIVGIAVQNKAARRLNHEGYLAYRQKNWGLALKKFARATELDPYYTYPIYNQACVLSLRARSKDMYRIYRLLLEVLLRAEYREKIQKDPDLAWFRSRAPDLLANLNAVQTDSEVVYHKLRERPVWNIETTIHSQNSVLELPDPESANHPENEPTSGIKKQIKSQIIQDRTGNSAKSQSDEQLENSDDLEAVFSKPLPLELDFGAKDDEADFSSFRRNRKSLLHGFSVNKKIFEEGFEKNLDSSENLAEDANFDDLALWPTGPDAQPAIMFRGYRYIWRFPSNSSGKKKWFELRGFFTVQGNIVILETFATNPKELENLPFHWDSFRSILLVYQAKQFVAVSAAGEQIKIYQ